MTPEVTVGGALVRCVVVGTVAGSLYLAALRLMRVSELALVTSTARGLARRLTPRRGRRG